jgi:hypothetical protein
VTANVLVHWPEALGIAAGVIVLFLFAVLLAFPLHRGRLPGSSGHRKEGEEEAHEEIRPDGYIDSFANTIEEAGGGLPPIVKLAIPGIIIWWLVYLILYWTPK